MTAAKGTASKADENPKSSTIKDENPDQMPEPSPDSDVLEGYERRYHLISPTGTIQGASFDDEMDALNEARTTDPGFGVFVVVYPVHEDTDTK